MCACGAETIDALTPGATVVTLDVDHVFVAPGEPWPRRIFTLAVAGRRGPVVAQATPALELTAGPRDVRQGPYRRQHRCPLEDRETSTTPAAADYERHHDPGDGGYERALAVRDARRDE